MCNYKITHNINDYRHKEVEKMPLVNQPQHPNVKFQNGNTILNIIMTYDLVYCRNSIKIFLFANEKKKKNY